MADSETGQPDSTAPRLSVALSGGGHRATLFSLGALLYLVDAGCSKLVDSVVSVSGGSITSAAVAHGCDFPTVDVEEFDHVAARIASTIVHRGVLFSAATTYAFLLVCGLLTSYLVVETLFDWPFDLPWWVVLPGLAVVATALSLRGHLLSRLLEREYFAAQRPMLGDLDCQVTHVFAATDLNSGAPIYFSTAAGGTIDSPVLKTAPCPSLAVADVVRASAAFPGGFPPKRLSLARSGLVWMSRTEGLDDFERKFGWIGRTRRGMKSVGGDADIPRSLRPPRALFLSDGGVWNNLGTDWTPPLGKDDVPGSRVRLVVDASAPVASRRMGGLNVPGLAEGLAIFRTMSVLYSNTVEPRVKALDGEAAQAMRERTLGTGRWSLPAVIRVVDGREQLMRRYSRICRQAGVDREPELFRGPNGEVADLWGWLYKTHHTIHGKARPGLRLWNSTVGTTLGRVERNTAISLLMHGYVGAMTVLHAYAALPFAPRGRLDINRFSRLVDGNPSTTPAFTGVGDKRGQGRIPNRPPQFPSRHLPIWSRTEPTHKEPGRGRSSVISLVSAWPLRACRRVPRVQLRPVQRHANPGDRESAQPHRAWDDACLGLARPVGRYDTSVPRIAPW